MADLEKQHSQNMSLTPNDDFLDWNDYDEEYEEEDNKNEIQNEQSNTESKPIHKKESSELEDDTYNDTYSRSKTNRDYTYSGNYKKNYPPYYTNKNSFGSKKFSKQSKPFNKGYDNNNYYHRNQYYKRKPTNDIYNNNNKDYYKYNKEHNYESKKSYKTVEKEYDYDNMNDYERKSEKKNYGDKYYGKKNYNNYNNNRFKNDYNFRNTLSYSTREFNDDDKKTNNNNKNNKFKSEYKYNNKEEDVKEKTEENISKPTFYNSKINNNTQEQPIIQQKYIKTEDFIQIENLVNNINKIVKDTYINLKNKMNNNIEEQYGSLNINAKTYVPKKKKLQESNINNMNNNFNYEQNIMNNNMPSQNYMQQYY